MAPNPFLPAISRWAVVSTFPPTPCGLATFTQALVSGMSGHGARVDVVRLVDEPQAHRPQGVVHEWVSGVPAAAAAAVLNQYDVVMVQHEFGIYPGPDGDGLLALLALLRVRVITVLHTLLAHPSAHQRAVLGEVVAASEAVITMTHTARDRAVELYGARAERVHVIAHGAPDALVAAVRPAPWRASTPRAVAVAAPRRSPRPVILTWGLLGRGKGIEWGIQALALLAGLVPRPVYVIAGRTHPRVLEVEGELYRRGLTTLAGQLGVGADVRFEDRYLDSAELHELVRSADVVLLPYDSVEQVTSGVLTEAVAAGRPVVSTSFPHATELLGDGTGLLVGRQDPAAIAAAVQRVLTEPGLAGLLSRRSAALAPDLSWRAVASRYLQLGAIPGTVLAQRPETEPRGAVVA